MPVGRWISVALLMVVLIAWSSGARAHADPVRTNPSVESIGLRLLDVPVDAAHDPRARVYIVDNLTPGTVIHRRIEVSSTVTDHAATLYPASATIAGGKFLGAAGHTPNELSTWTSVTPSAMTVHARQPATAIVTIAVPPGATPGERYAVVWAETRSASTSGVTEVSRVGIRIYLSVSTEAAPASNFSITALTGKRAADGSAVVLAQVQNTGGRALDMSGTLNLADGPGGLRAGPFPASLGTTLAIGDSEPVTIVLDKRLPAGPWRANVTLQSGVIERSAQANITFPDHGTAPPVTPSTSSRLRPYVVGVVIAIALVLALVFAVVTARRRRRRERVAASRGSAGVIDRAYTNGFSHDQRLEIVAKGLRGQESVRDLCLRNGITITTYCEWFHRLLKSDALPQADEQKRLTNGSARELSEAREHIAQLERSLGRKTYEADIAADASRSDVRRPTRR